MQLTMLQAMQKEFSAWAWKGHGIKKTPAVNQILILPDYVNTSHKCI